MRAIEGKNVVFEALKDGSYVPFACDTSLDFTYENELIEKTTPNSGNFREYVLGLGDWGVNISTVTHIVAVNPSYTVFDALTEAVRRNGIDIRITFEDSDGNLSIITGHVVIPRTSISAPVVGFSEDSIEFKGSGAFNLTTELETPPDEGDEEVFTVTPTPTEGDEEIVVPELEGVEATDIIEFLRDGIAKQIITVGDPTDKQVKFVSATGTFVLPYPVQGFEGQLEWFLILYK